MGALVVHIIEHPVDTILAAWRLATWSAG